MTQETKHTALIATRSTGHPGEIILAQRPTPHDALEGFALLDDTPENEERATFIVRAYNSYYAMLEVLEADIENMNSFQFTVWKKLRHEAIAKAKGAL